MEARICAAASGELQGVNRMIEVCTDDLEGTIQPWHEFGSSSWVLSLIIVAAVCCGEHDLVPDFESVIWSMVSIRKVSLPSLGLEEGILSIPDRLLEHSNLTVSLVDSVRQSWRGS